MFNWHPLLTLTADGINYVEKNIDIGGSIISAVVSSLISSALVALILKHFFFKQREIGRQLSSEGIEKVRIGKSGISRKDWNTLLDMEKKKTLQQLDMCFLTGRGFLVDNRDLFVGLLKKGVNINVLLASPRGQFLSEAYENCATVEELNAVHAENREALVSYYTDIVLKNRQPAGFLERAFAMLENRKYGDAFREKNAEKVRSLVYDKIADRDGEHIFQVNFVKLTLQGYLAESEADPASLHGKLTLSYYTDEYRVPIILLHVKDPKKNTSADNDRLVWTNLTAPAQEAENSVRLFCKGTDEDNDFVDAMEKSVEYLKSISEKVF